MPQAYSDPKREQDPHALPDLEVFYVDAEQAAINEANDDESHANEPGWYWWSCFPGCLPDGDPCGPFATEEEALDDAREGLDDGPEPEPEHWYYIHDENGYVWTATGFSSDREDACMLPSYEAAEAVVAALKKQFPSGDRHFCIENELLLNGRGMEAPDAQET
jgi:hypothetical protein